MNIYIQTFMNKKHGPSLKQFEKQFVKQTVLHYKVIIIKAALKNYRAWHAIFHFPIISLVFSVKNLLAFS